MPTSLSSKTEPPLTRKEMVRQALEALGTPITNDALQQFIWKTFRSNVDLELIGKYKSVLLQQQKKNSSPSPSAASSASQQTSLSGSLSTPSEVPSGKEAILSSVTISLADLQMVKGLVQRLGKENLQVLLDLLST
jgi:hypothetical protein